ncbi:MAG TPA: twin-arginine translocase TatA/TatE family subunit [bacterium (Candidatus Stahlbacteria)]|nr:twin-arginine translocase TatA/TatE family subunit [Candidatus Stahlbacteria bacterium]
MGLGWQEILLILLIVLILFGAKKIPEIARGLGKGVKEFKKAMHEIEREPPEETPPEESSKEKS